MKKVMLLAHRGFSGNYPENSPLAFHKAVEETGVDGFESDVHITKDGKLIIFHDASVERTSNGTGFIKDHTYEEMLQLDIGAWKSPEFAGSAHLDLRTSCSISATKPICCSIWS